jgi:hypothetical protein
MDRITDLDALRRHQQAALELLSHAVTCLEAGPEVVMAASPTLRRELGEVLGAYQRFKHERIFDPLIQSDDEQRAALARHMKVACIAAGEIFRTHMQRWRSDQIAAEWSHYRPSARLTANQLRRHIVTEGEGITELIETYATSG